MDGLIRDSRDNNSAEDEGEMGNKKGQDIKGGNAPSEVDRDKERETRDNAPSEVNGDKERETRHSAPSEVNGDKERETGNTKGQDAKEGNAPSVVNGDKERETGNIKGQYAKEGNAPSEVDGDKERKTRHSAPSEVNGDKERETGNTKGQHAKEGNAPSEVDGDKERKTRQKKGKHAKEGKAPSEANGDKVEGSMDGAANVTDTKDDDDVFGNNDTRSQANQPRSPGASRRKSATGTISNAPHMGGQFLVHAIEESSSPGSPGNKEQAAIPVGDPRMVLEPFAREYYVKPRRGIFGCCLKVPMETLLTWTRKPKYVPLTIACHMESELSSESKEAFRHIMWYMGDKKAKESSTKVLQHLQEILLEGSEELVDEVFCQVCKQTTSNPDANSDLRGWQLLLCILAVAFPSDDLMPFVEKHCELLPVGSIPQTYAEYSLSAMRKKPSIGQREWPPIDVEVMALVQLSCVPVLVRLQDETTVELIADSWTTTMALEKQIAEKLGLRSTIPYGIYEVSNTGGQRSLSSKERVLDAYFVEHDRFVYASIDRANFALDKKSLQASRWINEAPPKSKPAENTFQLYFKLRLRLRPNEDDLPGIKLYYLQAIRDLHSGNYDVTTEQCIPLVAYQLQASRGNFDKKTCTVWSLTKELPTILPQKVLEQPKSDEFKGVKDLVKQIIDYYMENLNGVSKKDARAKFLSLMYELPTYGRDYFQAKALGTEVRIGIGPEGVRFVNLSDPDLRSMGSYAFDTIESFDYDSDDDDVATMTLVPQGGEDSTIKTSIKIVSPEASHMKNLVHGYFVRYVMPKKAKELEERNAKKKKKKRQSVTGRKKRRGSTQASQGSEKKGKRRRSSVQKLKDKPCEV